MAIITSRFPARSTTRDTVEFKSFWTSPASADTLTKVAGTGTVSCVRTATGKYTVTFTGPPSATLIGCVGLGHGVTGVQPLIASCIFSTYSGSAGTVNIEFYNADATDTLADPIAAVWPKVELTFTFMASTL